MAGPTRERWPPGKRGTEEWALEEGEGEEAGGGEFSLAAVEVEEADPCMGVSELIGEEARKG